MDTVELLDTPKRTALSSRSTTLRTKLKDWEKSFAASHDGRKPGKDDIKANLELAETYKEYNRVRDVLAGKLGAEALQSPSARNTGKSRRRVTGQSSDLTTSITTTPRRRRESERHGVPTSHPNQLDPYDAPPSASPRPYLRNTIGPTPQRDGKVLGLFDLLSNSGRSSQATPSTRKRKINAVQTIPGEQINGRDTSMIAQTPSRKRPRSDDIRGDLLEHLDGGPESASRLRHSRTPASEGKKFMLSQFFATPNAMRFASIAEETEDSLAPITPNGIDQTPLRTHVLGSRRNDGAGTHMPGPDATPAYLKRSYSFKDRLLSVSNSSTVASRTNASQDLSFPSPTSVRTGPPTLRRYKSGPKPLSEIV